MNQEKVWNTIAEKWAEFRKKPIPEVQNFLKNKSGKILDLGCGSGRHFVKGKKIYAVDFSEEMLKLAGKKANSNIKLIKSSADNLPFPDDFFDSAIYIRTLHCIPSKKSRNKSLKEIYRVLKPDAKAMIQVWSSNHERLKNKKKGDYIPWIINQKQVQRYTYIYDKDEIEKEIKNAGFKILKIWEERNINVIAVK